MVAVAAVKPSFQDEHWPDSEHQTRDLRQRVADLEAAMATQSRLLARVIRVFNSNTRRIQLASDGLGTSEVIGSEDPPDNVVPLRSS